MESGPILKGCLVTRNFGLREKGIVLQQYATVIKVRLENGAVIFSPADDWEWTKAPSEPTPAWKAVQVIGETDSPMGRLLILRHPDGGKSLANPGAMHPLPAMAAEDAAVIAAAEEMEMRRSDLSESETDATRYDAFATARSKFQAVVRARAKAVPHEAPITGTDWPPNDADDLAPYGIDLSDNGSGPHVEALREKMVDAAIWWRVDVKCTGGHVGFHLKLAQAVDAYTTALNPAASVDPAAEITAASQALQAALDRAQKNITPERDRLRAALAREPK